MQDFWLHLHLLPNQLSLREIKEDHVVFNDAFDFKNKLPFDNAAVF